MANYRVSFKPQDQEAVVPTGTLISEAAAKVGIDLNMPCGGQGRCGRCAVIVEEGEVQRRSVARLSPEAADGGYALACQTVVKGDLVPFCLRPAGQNGQNHCSG